MSKLVKEPAFLALADGKVFKGYSCGSKGETSGEVVFNTSMTGYQEILTDPSYACQLMTFTYPHIGNVGVNDEDVESNIVHTPGVIVREMSDHYSNFRAKYSLQKYLEKNNVVGIEGIDTRELVLYLREKGSQKGIIASGDTDTDELIDKAKACPDIQGRNLADEVSTVNSYEWTQGKWKLGKGYQQLSDEELSRRPLVVAIDFGVKFNILRELVASGFRVKVVPISTSAEDILKLSPDAIFLSNGPGDPAAVTAGIKTVKDLLGKKPIFGICLGHQILGLALGAPTYKLKFGHRGGNHPVKNLNDSTVEITVQNHGFATDSQRVPKGIKISHINLNDHTVEGFEVAEAKAFSSQYHPEASPGPHDAEYLFQEFFNMAVK